MATKTHAPLDSGLLNALGITLFKQLPDHRWACFFLFGGKKGRILPSEETGRFIVRVAFTGSLVGCIASGIALIGVARLEIVNPATDLLVRCTAALAPLVGSVVPTGLWLRRRYGNLPTTQERLTRGEFRFQIRGFFWLGLALATVVLFSSGYIYGVGRAEEALFDFPYAKLLFATIPATATTLAAICILSLELILRAAHRGGSTQTETT